MGKIVSYEELVNNLKSGDHPNTKKNMICQGGIEIGMARFQRRDCFIHLHKVELLNYTFRFSAFHIPSILKKWANMNNIIQ